MTWSPTLLSPAPALLALALLACAVVRGDAETAAKVPSTLWDVEINYLDDGKPVNFAQYKHERLFLIANVASQCGFTASGYEQLQALHEKFHEEGLLILGVPCGQFGDQEFDAAKDILDFAAGQGAGFRLTEKVDVNGPNAHMLFRYLKGEQHPDDGCHDTASGDECAKGASGELRCVALRCLPVPACLLLLIGHRARLSLTLLVYV